MSFRVITTYKVFGAHLGWGLGRRVRGPRSSQIFEKNLLIPNINIDIK